MPLIAFIIYNVSIGTNHIPSTDTNHVTLLLFSALWYIITLNFFYHTSQILLNYVISNLNEPFT